MSKAGIQSNRGDGYQTLIAFDWALQVLADPVYEWIEVDSATSPGSATPKTLAGIQKLDTAIASCCTGAVSTVQASMRT